MALVNLCQHPPSLCRNHDQQVRSTGFIRIVLLYSYWLKFCCCCAGPGGFSQTPMVPVQHPQQQQHRPVLVPYGSYGGGYVPPTLPQLQSQFQAHMSYYGTPSTTVTSSTTTSATTTTAPTTTASIQWAGGSAFGGGGGGGGYGYGGMTGYGGYGSMMTSSGQPSGVGGGYSGLKYPPGYTPLAPSGYPGTFQGGGGGAGGGSTKPTADITYS